MEIIIKLVVQLQINCNEKHDQASNLLICLFVPYFIIIEFVKIYMLFNVTRTNLYII